MPVLSLIWGILAVLGMLVGFIPCLGALNWLNIPFAGVGLLVSAVAYSRAEEEDRRSCLAGICLCAVAAVFGLIRLVIGLGMF
jgi:hypothetical protein